MSGSVHQKAYSRLITNPSRQLLAPIIQWIECTSVTGNDKFSLKPYMFTPAILQNRFGAPFKLGATMDICQKVKHQLQGDNIRNYHARLSQVLHRFRTAESRLRGVALQ
jgi:hypothetical protein